MHRELGFGESLPCHLGGQVGIGNTERHFEMHFEMHFEESLPPPLAMSRSLKKWPRINPASTDNYYVEVANFKSIKKR
jgi:hypothetical protein